MLRALDRYWMAPAPPERLATVRVLVGAYAFVYLVVRAPVMADFSALAPSRFEPVGVARILAGPLPAAVVWSLWGASVLLAAAFALGVRYRVVGPAFAAVLLWVATYRTSWGMLFHTDNLLVLHALSLGLAPGAADALSVAAGRRMRSAEGASVAPLAAGAAHGWPLRLLAWLTVAAYALAGIAKLRESGFTWAEGEILRNYIAFDAVRKLEVGSVHSPFGAWLVAYEAPFRVIGVLSLALELGGPVALLHPRLTRAWVVGLWGFHVGVVVVMAIAFPYPLSGVAFAALLPCERIWRWRGLRRAHAWLGGASGASARGSP
jgi:hypothetical protein